MSQKNSAPKILSIGISTPESRYTQKEIAVMMGVETPKALRFFEHEHIKTRHLILPHSKNSQKYDEESPAKLREKFLTHSVALIEKALTHALEEAHLKKTDIDYLTVVTSTGFVVPGLSALVIENLKLKSSTQRVDIVGMGCNAGLNGLNTVSNWCSAHPEKIGVLICCELCSCIYSIEDNENAAIVNSLFGDGVAVSILKASAENNGKASVLDFESHVIPNSLPYLRFDFNEEKNKNSFYVDKKTPPTLAQDIELPFNRLIERNHLKLSDIKHWVVHSGGSAILDAIEQKLRLDHKAFRHTRHVLRHYGNISSGSFLFSYRELMQEKVVKPGEYGMMITMGPGLTIEMALIKW